MENCECTCNEEVRDPNCKCEGTCHCNDKKVKKNKAKEEIEHLKKQVNLLAEENLRSKADLINYRKRKDEEVSRMLNYANEDLILEILPAVDNFERAIKLDNQDLTDELSKFLSGFKMIYCNMVATLEKYGVKAIDGVNKPFDPTYHQAVLTEKVEGMAPGMVVEIMQKGYLLKDKVIRHAMVKVSE